MPSQPQHSNHDRQPSQSLTDTEPRLFDHISKLSEEIIVNWIRLLSSAHSILELPELDSRRALVADAMITQAFESIRDTLTASDLEKRDIPVINGSCISALTQEESLRYYIDKITSKPLHNEEPLDDNILLLRKSIVKTINLIIFTALISRVPDSERDSVLRIIEAFDLEGEEPLSLTDGIMMIDLLTSLTNEERTALTPVLRKFRRLLSVYRGPEAFNLRTDFPEKSSSIEDPQTGLTLPPPSRKPYSERGRHHSGRRLTVFEHLQEEYSDYIDAGLLYSGHIKEIDESAYAAVLHLASKNRKSGLEPTTSAEFFSRHGILTAETLKHPPPKFERQVRLIKALHQKRIEAGLRAKDALDR